ncbi:MAG: glycerate kinase [Bacteroidales bacterium]|nr:glycerate kinase [Bacteroidales bacterium]
MKIVLAFDKFKGVASSRQLAEAARDGILQCIPGAQVVMIPCADGGEGTMEALAHPLAQRMAVEVAGPLPGTTVRAHYALHGTEAVMEMAAASGLALIPDASRDVMRATTLGTGQLMRHAIDHGARRIVLGIGGSATNDCAMGMLTALGFRFLDAEDRPVEPCGESLGCVAKVDASAVPPEVRATEFAVVTDVDNPLCGPHGAAAVYAPQKGASPQQVALLDAGARQFSALMPAAVPASPGAGAAGGVGAGLMAFLGATLYPGAEAVLRFLHVEDAIADAHLVLTGEGRIDASTAHGKLPYAVARLCRRHGVPAVALCGMLDGSPAEAFTAVHCINPEPVDLPAALQPEVCLQRITLTVKKILNNFNHP